MKTGEWLEWLSGDETSFFNTRLQKLALFFTDVEYYSKLTYIWMKSDLIDIFGKTHSHSPSFPDLNINSKLTSANSHHIQNLIFFNQMHAFVQLKSFKKELLWWRQSKTGYRSFTFCYMYEGKMVKWSGDIGVPIENILYL